MTEESFQQCRKVMQKANYLRGTITSAKGEVAKWTQIEQSHKENFQYEKAASANRMLKIAMVKLQEQRDRFAELKFPDENLLKTINRCVSCGKKIDGSDKECEECISGMN